MEQLKGIQVEGIFPILGPINSDWYKKKRTVPSSVSPLPFPLVKSFMGVMLSKHSIDEVITFSTVTNPIWDPNTEIVLSWHEQKEICSFWLTSKLSDDKQPELQATTLMFHRSRLCAASPPVQPQWETVAHLSPPLTSGCRPAPQR